MPTDLTGLHEIFEIISGIAMGGAFIVGLMIKSSLGSIRESQLENQIANDRIHFTVKEELVARSEKISSDLRTHQAEDSEVFKNLQDDMRELKSDVKTLLIKS